MGQRRVRYNSWCMVAAGQVVGLVEETLLLQFGWQVVVWVCSGGVSRRVPCVF